LSQPYLKNLSESLFQKEYTAAIGSLYRPLRTTTLLGKKPTFCHISTAVAGSYRYPDPRVMVKVNLKGDQVVSSALMVFLQLYQKKAHSHAKKHVRMFFLHLYL